MLTMSSPTAQLLVSALYLITSPNPKQEFDGMLTRVLCGWGPVVLSLLLSTSLFLIVTEEVVIDLDRLPNLHRHDNIFTAEKTAAKLIELRQTELSKHFQKLTKGDIDSSYQFNGECKWVQTSGCSPYGELEPSENRGCQDPLAATSSGICQCTDERLFGKSCTAGNTIFYCSEVCGTSDIPRYLNYTEALRYQDSGNSNGISAYFVTFSPTKKYTRLIRMLKSLGYATSQWSKLYPLTVIHDPEDGFSTAYKGGVEKSLASTRRYTVHYIKASPEYYNIPRGISVHQIPLYRHKKIRNMDSLQYRQAARYLAGFVHREYLFKDVAYLIMLPDEIVLLCKIPYDVPLYMKTNNKTIGYTTMYHEPVEAMPSLASSMDKALSVVNESGKIKSKNLYKLFISDKNYNGCGFGATPLVVATKFLRSKKYTKLFSNIEATGGFFYERWAYHSTMTLLAASVVPLHSWIYLESIGVTTPHNGHHIPHDPFVCIGEPIPNRFSEGANDWRHPCLQMLLEG